MRANREKKEEHKKANARLDEDIEKRKSQRTKSISVSQSLLSSIEKLITAKIDRLPPTHSLILRVCSCIATRFNLDILSAVLPLNISKEELSKEVKKREREREREKEKTREQGEEELRKREDVL
jgi:predicted ATPase